MLIYHTIAHRVPTHFMGDFIYGEIMVEIKTIETFYNGYRFRRRLEARWAVFFDKAGIPYEYEKEGFVICGIPYLPDFYLPSFECYVEIKPYGIILDNLKQTVGILKTFSKEKPIILCSGDPYNSRMAMFDKGKVYLCKFAKGCKWYFNGIKDHFGYKNNFTSILCETDDYIKFTASFTDGTFNYSEAKNVYSCDCVFRYDFEREKLFARQARFEYGEKPTF